LVRLEEGTMSTRHGRVVFLEDVLNKAIEKTREIIVEKNPNAGNIDKIARDVGVGAVMFNELSNNRVKDYTFSWDHVLNFDGETGPYVQYTHARCASLMRKAGEEAVKKAEDAANVNFKYLTGDNSYDLVKLIYTYPEVIEQAGEKYEPSLVTRHLIRLAQGFNKFYHDEQILVENEEEKIAKLALVIASKNVIKSALALLGIEAPERM
jgi:arginyl-tRNA synthetase